MNNRRAGDEKLGHEMSSSGIELHDSLKERFGFDRGIVRSYRTTYGEVEPRAPISDDLVEERLVALGDETTNSVGTGRPWVIDVERRTSDGALVSIERWSMFGYPSNSARAEREPSATSNEPTAEVAIDELLITEEFVRSNATANAVTVAVHHDSDAARAAGARDIFLDTATQVALFRTRAEALLGTEHRVSSVELRMRAPICAGDTINFVTEGSAEVSEEDDARLELRLRAVVGGVTVSTAVVAFRP
jgi:hypothetical protein